MVCSPLACVTRDMKNAPAKLSLDEAPPPDASRDWSACAMAGYAARNPASRVKHISNRRKYGRIRTPETDETSKRSQEFAGQQYRRVVSLGCALVDGALQQPPGRVAVAIVITIHNCQLDE